MAHYRSNIHAKPTTHGTSQYGLQGLPHEKVTVREIKTGSYHQGKEDDHIRTSFAPTVHSMKSQHGHAQHHAKLPHSNVHQKSQAQHNLVVPITTHHPVPVRTSLYPHLGRTSFIPHASIVQKPLTHHVTPVVHNLMTNVMVDNSQIHHLNAELTRFKSIISQRESTIALM